MSTLTEHASVFWASSSRWVVPIRAHGVSAVRGWCRPRLIGVCGYLDVLIPLDGLNLSTSPKENGKIRRQFIL